MDINLTLRLFEERDDTSLAEVSELPGALAPGVRATDSCVRAVALALRIVADRIENQELSDESAPEGSFTVRFSLEGPARLRLQNASLRNAVDEAVFSSVSPQLVEQLHDHLLEPLSAQVGDIRRAVADSLGDFGQDWRPTSAPVVLQALAGIGWRTKRGTPRFIVLERPSWPDVCFPFDRLYTLRPVALERLAGFTGLRPEDVLH